MDELTIEGKTYISSKRAASVTGYAKDYVGQLCREGRVEAKLVGRSWYVYEPSIMKHRFSDEDAKGTRSVTQEEGSLESEDVLGDDEKKLHSSEKTNVQAVFGESVYQSEEVKELPLTSASELQTVEEMEESWRNWFTKEPEEPLKGSVEETKPHEAPVEEEVVPVHIVKTTTIEPEPVVIREKVQRAVPKRRKAPKTRGYRVFKAVCIGIMLISLSLAVVGAGLSGNIAGILKDKVGFIGYIEGITEIK